MSSNQAISSAERSLSPGAIAIVLLLCLSWGFNQIAVKLGLPDVPPLLQATMRSVGALAMLLLGARLRGVKMFQRDNALFPGLFAGLMFDLEFGLIYRALFVSSA